MYDRIIGFKLSSLLQRTIKSKSAGRVQSVTLRMIVDNDQEIKDFKPEEYWTLDIVLDINGTKVTATLDKIDGKTAAIHNKEEAEALLKRVADSYHVASLTKTKKRVPSKLPFTTSTMQQEAYNRFKFSTSMTQSIAQKLYEGLEVNGEHVGLNELIGSKPHLIVLSKNDKADTLVTARWIAKYNQEGITCFASNLKGEKVFKVLNEMSEPLVLKKREKEKKLGMKKQPLKLLIVGIPNVGKSTLINNLAGKRVARAANTPGVTRSEQWIKLSGDFVLLDTPGILPMNYEGPLTARRLAILGSIKEDVLPLDELYRFLFVFLRENYKNCLQNRYGIEDLSKLEAEEVLEIVAKNRGYLLKNGTFDYAKATSSIFKDFQEGYFGRISLERP